MITLNELLIKGGIRESFHNGTSKMADRPCYGYIKDDTGKLIINETEAKIVRWIFERYLAGNSLGKIADGLTEQGINSPTGNAKWNRQAIDKLLSNEKYAGFALLQKTFVEDVLKGAQVKNIGQREQILISNHHKAIIEKDVWNMVQAMKKK
jgi:hypothetical protein